MKKVASALFLCIMRFLVKDLSLFNIIHARTLLSVDVIPLMFLDAFLSKKAK
jgi:hypothetical protein